MLACMTIIQSHEKPLSLLLRQNFKRLKQSELLIAFVKRQNEAGDAAITQVITNSEVIVTTRILMEASETAMDDITIAMTTIPADAAVETVKQGAVDEVAEDEYMRQLAQLNHESNASTAMWWGTIQPSVISPLMQTKSLPLPRQQLTRKPTSREKSKRYTCC